MNSNDDILQEILDESLKRARIQDLFNYFSNGTDEIDKEKFARMIETLLSIHHDSQTVQSVKRKVTEHLVSRLQLNLRPLSLENFNYFADFQDQLMNDERMSDVGCHFPPICREGFVILHMHIYIYIYAY